MAAYAALTSLLQILDQLKHHPFPPISLDGEQVESLIEIATFLQEFLEGYNSPFVDSDEADPLRMRIADAAYEAEDVIESYIVDNIRFAAAATHDHEVKCSSGDQLNPEEKTNSYEDVSSGGESSFSGEEDSNSNEETASLDDEVNSSSGDEVNSEEEINSNEETASLDDEVNSCSTDQVNSEEEINSDEDASSGLAGEAINISGGEISCVHMYQDLWRVTEEMDLVKKEAMEKTAVQAHHQPQRNILRSSSFGGKNSGVMVGFDGVLLQLLHKLTGEPSSLQVIPITGMGGIGKTTLARNTFQHAYVKKHFDICAWVTISQQYSTIEIVSQIFYQASGKSSEKSTVEDIGDELRRYLFDRRYLIIMDDIWTIKVWEEMSFYFPDCNQGSRIVYTSRQSFLTNQITKDSDDVFHMKFLDQDNSWNLFTKTVFGGECFPPELEIVGKKIVEKCRGLPLSIVVIGGLLAKSQNTQKYWKHVEQKLGNDELCLKILKLSYHHLPAYLKPCFLYMGIFEEDKRIHVSTLIKLWVCEGFIKPENGQSLELIGEGFVKDLIDRNLILVDVLGKTGNIKFCKMHDLLRDLCMREAENERFYHVIVQHSRRGIQNHKRRRMVSDRSTSEERVMGALESTRFHVRSLTYGSEFGWFEYEDVIVNSHYAAIINFSEKHKLLSSVNFFWNLHILRINVGNEWIVAPVEIWKMSQLRHVKFHGSRNMYLPNPPSGSSIVVLENLQTLKGIRNFKCGEEMVKRIPNIKNLGIVYNEEIRRYNGVDYCLSNLHSLHKLESLNIKVCQVDNDFLNNIIFPQSLIKLSLSLDSGGNSVGWEEMLEKIGGSLPLLQKLKLYWGVFKTGKWETVEGQFPSLKFLELFYCSGLKQWMIEESSHFPCLEHLILYGLEELEEIPLEIGEIPMLQSVKVSYCSESAVKSAKKIVEEQEKLQGGEEHLPFLVRVKAVWMVQKALESLESRNFQIKWYSNSAA